MLFDSICKRFGDRLGTNCGVGYVPELSLVNTQVVRQKKKLLSHI